MGTKKTRFTILRDGVEQLLFSVEDKKSGGSKGDLLLFFPTAGFYEDGMSGVLERTTEQRVSIHVSPGSIGHTINGHTRTEEVAHRNPAAYFELDREHPYWLLSSNIPGDLDRSTVYQRKAGDTTRTILSLDTSQHTLLYLIWISRPDLPQLRSDTAQFFEDFSFFSLNLMFYKIPVRSTPEGYTNFIATSPRLTNDEPDDAVCGTNFEGLSAEEAQERNNLVVQRACLSLYRRVLRIGAASGYDPRQFGFEAGEFERGLRALCCLGDREGPPRPDGKPNYYPIANPFHPDFDLPFGSPIKPPARPL